MAGVPNESDELDERSVERQQRLERILRQRPELLAFVWMRGDARPGWLPVALAEGRPRFAASGAAVERPSGILLLYPRTRGVFHVEGGDPQVLPAGGSYLESRGRSALALARRRVGTGWPLEVGFAPSPIWPEGRSRCYETRLTNVAQEAVRVERFGGFRHGWLRLRLHTVTGAWFSADEFRDWYDVKDDEGWIQPGETVADPTNYAGPRSWWVYMGTTASGAKFIVGGRGP